MCTNSNISYLSNVLTTIYSQCERYWEVKPKGNTKSVSLIQDDLICSQYFLVSKNIWIIYFLSWLVFRFWLFVLKIISRKLIRLQNFPEENLSFRKHVLREFFMTSHRLDISLDDNFSSLQIFRRLFLVLINLPVTTPRLEKSFDDFSFTKTNYIILLVLIYLYTTSPRTEGSFEDNIITRCHPQNIFQDEEVSSKVHLKNTPRLHTYSHEISSSRKKLEDNVITRSRLRTHFITRKYHPKFFEEFSSSWCGIPWHLLVLRNLSKMT